jgi:hypothetical protein
MPYCERHQMNMELTAYSWGRTEEFSAMVYDPELTYNCPVKRCNQRHTDRTHLVPRRSIKEQLARLSNGRDPIQTELTKIEQPL